MEDKVLSYVDDGCVDVVKADVARGEMKGSSHLKKQINPLQRG